jgi:serine/threonine-protein kinase HipA
MRIRGKENLSQLQLCLSAASSFLLSPTDAEALMVQQIQAIQHHFDAVCDEGGVSDVDRRLLRGRQFLNPFVFEGASPRIREAAER